VSVERLAEVLRRDFPFFKDVVDRSAADGGPEWRAEVERTLQLFAEPGALEAAVRGYAHFVADLLRRQRRFERDRVYPERSYADALEHVYSDERYMTEEYLPGLLLAHHLWPHHRRHAAFFDVAFAAAMRDAAHFVEVGIGTGFYSRRLLERLPQVRGVGYDVSPASAAFTLRHLEALGLADRYETKLQDVVADPIPPAEWLVCIEVLEHLEDPVGFLRALREAVTGKAFITAALNAAHVDHLYLYETTEQVLEQLTEAGFHTEQALLATAHPPTAPGVPVPAVAAFVVS
jgi:2-polyprenyl-3-methyl-5-hydroxy-6-metoxy-1,4-benzoquinol methylase